MKRDDTYFNVRKIMDGTGLAKVVDAPKGRGLRFPVYLNKQMEEEDIECLELSRRSTNCLKRAGVGTIGDLCRNYNSSGELRKLRNCGETSVAEIMDRLFLYNYQQLQPEQRDTYIAAVVKMNN